jgi:DNA polymerase
MELALQYYGGVGAFCAMAETYSLDLKKLAVDAKGAVPPGIMSAALAKWEGTKKNARGYGLDVDTWAVLQSLVTMWRRAHPATVRFWRHLDEAVRTVINDSSVARVVGRVSVSRVGNWLRIKLPSGRFLCYPGIRIEPDGQISFLGVNPYSRRWGRIHTYSGKLTENIAQGGCADLLYDAVLDAEDAHYHTVLTVHDELITDVPDTDEFTPDELCRIMGSASPWARSLPLAAKGATKYRYGK